MFHGPRRIGGSYVGYVDPYRHKIAAWSAAGLSLWAISRRLYDEGLRPPRSLFVQPRCPEVERDPMAHCIYSAIVYMLRRDALYRRVHFGTH